MYINSSVLTTLVAILIGLILAYKIICGLLSSITGRGSKTDSAKPVSLSSILVILGIIFILVKAYKMPPIENIIPKPEREITREKEAPVRVNQGPSKQEKRSSEAYEKPKPLVKEDLPDSYDYLKRPKHNTPPDPFEIEDDVVSFIETEELITPSIHANEFFIQVSCANTMADAIKVANKHAEYFGVNNVFIGEIRKIDVQAFAYKILIGQNFNREEAKRFIRNNKTKLKNSSWIRSIDDFDQLSHLSIAY